MTPDFTAALRELEEHGWVTLLDVSADEQTELRQRFRQSQRDAGWWIRTSYHAPSRTLSIARSLRI